MQQKCLEAIYTFLFYLFLYFFLFFYLFSYFFFFAPQFTILSIQSPVTLQITKLTCTFIMKLYFKITLYLTISIQFIYKHMNYIKPHIRRQLDVNSKIIFVQSQENCIQQTLFTMKTFVPKHFDVKGRFLEFRMNYNFADYCLNCRKASVDAH